MFKVWGKLIKENRMLRDTVVTIEGKELSRTKKVYKALEDICYEFDIAVPFWLDNNNKDFIRYSKTRFNADNFIETIEFDYLDFQVLDEDHFYE